MKFLLFFLPLLLLSCSSAKVTYDYDTKKDFSIYNTYAYYPELKTGLSDLDTKRLLTATDSIMKVKGFNFSNKNPQLYINFTSEQYQTPNNRRIGIGIGNGPISIGGGIPLGRPNQHIRLLMDIVETANNELIWQANIDDVQNSSNTPKNRASFFYIMMEKVLNKYPIKK